MIATGQSTRALNVIVMWLMAWVTMQMFGQVVLPDGILTFLKTQFRRA